MFEGDNFNPEMARLLALWKQRDDLSDSAHAEGLQKVKRALSTVILDSEQTTIKSEGKIDTTDVRLPHTPIFYDKHFNDYIDVLFKVEPASNAIVLTSPAVSQFFGRITDSVVVAAADAGIIGEALLKQNRLLSHKMTAVKSRKYSDGFPWVTLTEGSPVLITRLNKAETQRLQDQTHFGKKTLGIEAIEDYEGNVSEATISDADENTHLPFKLLRRFKRNTDQSRETNWEFLEENMKGDLNTPEAALALLLEYKTGFLTDMRNLRRTFLTDGFASLLAQERGYNW